VIVVKLNEILESRGIPFKSTKLMRHNVSDKIVAQIISLGYFDFYQATQKADALKNCEYFLSFLGIEGTSGKFYGCYKVNGVERFKHELRPLDYPDDNANEEAVFYDIEKAELLSDLENRLIIDWGKGTRSWLQNATTEKEVLRILPAVSEYEFLSYDKVLLTYETLLHIVNNSVEHKIWEEKLSTVAGVYLITDIKTGKHYVGSASSNDNGIWGRWNDYAKTKHGGNKRLIKLISDDVNYCNNFIFSILDVFPMKRDRSEILEYEQLYKKKLCSVQFGLNDN
jgi:hypothetical protein